MRTLLQRVRRARSWLRHRALQPAVILCYHRVTVLDRNPHLLAITPAQFEDHLRVIRDAGTPTTLRDLAHALRDGRPVRNAIVVTFDDGYADNLYEAKPLLERYEVPATVFVSTGQIGASTEYWWDALDQLMLGTHALPAHLPLGEDGEPIVVPPLARRAAADVTDADEVHARAQQRDALMHHIRNLLLEMHPTRIAAVVRGLHDATSVSSEARASHRCCSADELRSLARGGLVEIGAHTVTHPRLSRLDTDAQTREMREGRQVLESLLDTSVTTIAYPFGRDGDIDAGTLVAAKAAGFEAGCTLGAAPISTSPMFAPAVDTLLLPRYAVHPIDGDALDRQLRTSMRA